MFPFDTTASEHSATLTRRRVLAAGGVAGVAALAGCNVGEFTVEEDLDGNLLIGNGAPHRVSGSITVQDPTGEMVLDETFDLPAKATRESPQMENATTTNATTTGENGTATNATNITNENTTNGTATNATNTTNATGNDTVSYTDSTATHHDILTEPGDYVVAVDLDEGSEIRGRRAIEQVVSVSDTGEQSIVVGLDVGEGDIVGMFADSGAQLDEPIWVAVSDGKIEYELGGNVSVALSLSYDDVNVDNLLNRPISGSIEVRDPSNETVLDSSFTLGADDECTDNETENNETAHNGTDNETENNETAHNGTDNETENNETAHNGTNDEKDYERYSGVFTDDGEYTVSVELEDGEAIEGVRSAVETVDVTIDDSHIVVALGTNESDDVSEDEKSPIRIESTNFFNSNREGDTANESG